MWIFIFNFGSGGYNGVKYAGIALAGCNDSLVRIEVRADLWPKSIFPIVGYNGFYEVPYSVSLMWHEFGHDILNLEHTCQDYHIMNSRYYCSDANKAKETSTWVYDHPDDNKNWQRAVKDMFEGVGQNPYSCGNGNRSYTTCNHSHIQDED